MTGRPHQRRDRGVASGVFEIADDPFGGAVGASLYATVIAAAGYREAFLSGAGPALLGLVAASPAPHR